MAEPSSSSSHHLASSSSDLSGVDLTFNAVNLIKRNSPVEGTLKFTSKGFVFKRTGGQADQVLLSQVSRARWMRVARGCQLRFFLEKGGTTTYDGFKKTDLIPLADYFKKVLVEFTIEDRSVKGQNYGDCEFGNGYFAFKVDSLTAFEIPLTEVSNASVNKNDATVEFLGCEDQQMQAVESMRFYIPNDDETEEEKSRAELFVENVMKNANVVKITGEAVAAFTEMPCLTPRGRYDLDLFATFFRLHGKTYDYKIPYDTVLRLYLLPKPDNRHMYFVVHLEPPIRQGQTRYPFLVFQFSIDETVTLKLNLQGGEKDQEIINERTKDIPEEQDGKTFEVLSLVFKSLSQKKVSGSGQFRGAHSPAIKCTHKSNDGFMYPMSNGFMFLPKPAFLIRYSEVVSVSFDRVSSASKSSSFDIMVETKSAPFEFKSIEQAEYQTLVQFLREKKINIGSIQQTLPGRAQEEEDFGLSDESEEDPYVSRLKGERGGNTIGTMALGDDDESDDESFQADDDSDSESDDGSGSAVSEDLDDNPKKKKKSAEGAKKGDGHSSASKKKKEDDSDGEKPKKKKKPASSESDEDESESEDDGKKKKKGGSKEKKKSKDPNEPKKPKTSYLLWCDDNRAAIKAENPSFTMIDVQKALAAKWRDVESGDKMMYEEAAEKLRGEYSQAMAAYKASKPASRNSDDDSDEGDKKTKKAKKDKDPNAPKRPVNPYFLFQEDMRSKLKAENPEMSNNDIVKKTSELWKQMSKEDQAPFTEKANTLMEKYKKDLEEYNKNKPASSSSTSSSKKPASGESDKKKEPSSSSKPSSSSSSSKPSSGLKQATLTSMSKPKPKEGGSSSTKESEKSKAKKEEEVRAMFDSEEDEGEEEASEGDNDFE